VALDRLQADDQVLGDRRVRPALRHQREDLALALGQRRQRVGPAPMAE
jgi:hypothetical protein